MEYIQDASDICLSGGADGADLEWGNCAAAIGHKVIHWSFHNHRSGAPEYQLIRLDAQQLSVADKALSNAAIALGKTPPKRPYISSLLQRNYYQVAWSRSCYAVTFLNANAGTAWAITMFRQLHPESGECYVFCQEKGEWYQVNEDSDGWERIEMPPRPTGIWAGIGARNLMDNGREAIRKLMNCEGNG